MQGLKKFSVRGYARDGEIRGFTLLFDQMMETIVAPVTGAMVSVAFSPFPERSSPFAATAKSVEYGNGLIVSARGHIITDRNLATECQGIVAAGLGDADRVAEDKDNGLALLRVYGARKLAPPLGLAPDPSKKGRGDVGRHSGSERAGWRQEAYRNRGAAGWRKCNRIAPAGTDGRLFGRCRARHARSVSGHDRDAEFRACQYRADRTAGTAYHCRDDPGLSRRA